MISTPHLLTEWRPARESRISCQVKDAYSFTAMEEAGLQKLSLGRSDRNYFSIFILHVLSMLSQTLGISYLRLGQLAFSGLGILNVKKL